MPGKAGQTLRCAASSSPYAAIAACQMGLAPHLTWASPPPHRFRLYDLEAWDFLDRLNFTKKFRSARTFRLPNK